MARALRLPIVPSGDELDGAAPPAFERAARSCALGGAAHRGIVITAVAVGRFAARACAPPSASATLLDALDVADAWASRRADEGAVRRARSETFSAAPAITSKTAEAVRALADTSATSALDAHADHVVLRYARLGAFFSASGVLSCLDAVDRPPEAAKVVQQAAGALAYRDIGLGFARSGDLRAKAAERAAWEAELESAHDPSALAMQIFHEFLGSRWKDVSDAHRAYLGDFVEWAIGAAT